MLKTRSVQTHTSIGMYLEPFATQERALARERNRFLGALALSVTAIGLIANPEGSWTLGLSAFVVASLMAFCFSRCGRAARLSCANVAWTRSHWPPISSICNPWAVR